jgi:hypothetical protein
MRAEGVSATSLRPGAPILLLSNGHGEDLSGALIATELRARGYRAEALPLVGHGRAYDQAAIPLLGRTREYSTGGLGYTSLWGRLTEVVQGQVGYLLRRLALLFRIAHRYDLVVVVGDVLPVAAAWLSWRPVVTYLVAYSSHYEGRLKLPWPCGACLASGRFRRVLSRDALTASDLSEQLGRPVDFLGNPFFDAAVAPSEPLGAGQPAPAPPGADQPLCRFGPAPRRVAQTLRPLVHQAFSGDQPHVAGQGLLEQGVDRFGMHRAEDHGGCRAVGQQAVQEPPGGLLCVGRIGESPLGREGVALKPAQQRPAR